MPIYTKGAGYADLPWENCPPGTYNAVIADVSTPFTVQQSYKGSEPKPVEKVIITFQVAKQMKDGRRFIVSERYTNSLSPKGHLRKVIVAARTSAAPNEAALTPMEEAEGVDLESLIGLPLMVEVANREWQGKTYANVVNVITMMEGLTPIAVEGYTRKDKNPTLKGVSAPIPQAVEDHGWEGDKDIPF